MSHYRPYAGYKASGVDCIGDMPEHWEIARVARLGSLRKANGGSKEDNVDAGVPCVRYGDLYTTHDHWIRHTTTFIAEEKAADYTPIRHGDVLFAASGETFEEIGKSAVNLLADGACCGGDVIVLRPSPAADPLFLGYALDCSVARAQKAQMGKGFTVKHIYADQLRNLLVALPPVGEQRAIAAALDRETARIDALIEKKTEFIELLNRKRRLVIAHAVTKGLDPKTKRRDSGYAWIGAVPAHWLIAPVKYVARLESGHTPSRQHPEYWENCTVAWFTLADIWQVRKAGRSVVFETAEKVSELGLANSSARRLPAGTVILSRTASVGFPAILGVEMATSQDFGAWICGARLHNVYLYYVLLAMRPELDRLMIGSTHKTIYMPDIEAFRCPLPD